jgi:hypothetical protein
VKGFIAAILFLCLCCQCFVQLGVIGWYELNKKYIAANLCENRDKPAMHCNGKCCLKKQLKKLDDEKSSQNGNSSTKQMQPDAVVFIMPQSISFSYHQFQTLKIFGPGYKDGYSFVAAGDIFHPPCYNAAFLS